MGVLYDAYYTGDEGRDHLLFTSFGLWIFEHVHRSEMF
jgi:hypothetical protein